MLCVRPASWDSLSPRTIVLLLCANLVFVMWTCKQSMFTQKLSSHLHETSCGLTHVHKWFSRNRRSKFLRTGNNFRSIVICLKHFMRTNGCPQKVCNANLCVCVCVCVWKSTSSFKTNSHEVIFKLRATIAFTKRKMAQIFLIWFVTGKNDSS